MKRPHISEHSLVKVSGMLDRGESIDECDPPLTDNERWWYNALKAEREEFAKEHPDIKPIWDIPTSYE